MMELVKVTEEMMMEQDGERVGGDSNHWIYLTNFKAYKDINDIHHIDKREF